MASYNKTKILIFVILAEEEGLTAKNVANALRLPESSIAGRLRRYYRSGDLVRWKMRGMIKRLCYCYRLSSKGLDKLRYWAQHQCQKGDEEERPEEKVMSE